MAGGVEGQAIEPVLHLHGLEERGRGSQVTLRRVGVTEPALETPEPEMASRDEGTRAELLGQLEGDAEVMPRDLLAGSVLFGGDVTEEPVRVHLVAALTELQ